MFKKLLSILFLLLTFHCFGQQDAEKNRSGFKGDFTVGKNEFLLNGKPFVIRAGELHFPRIPKEYWDHRIKLCKAMGMNTICIYLFWNYHEEQENKFDFSGSKDVAEFVQLVQQNGMYCIVRPGPYACAEWDMGGLPWWLLKKPDLKVRTLEDPYFMERAAKYLKEVGKQLAPLQIQNGGNIIMVQVENEYAAFGNSSEYMEAIRKAVRGSGFDKVQLFRCDWSSTFNEYKVNADVATTLNFGAGSDVEKQFKAFKKMHPEAPQMCSEYWTGWFDNWGRQHETRSISSFIGSLKDMLDRKISFSLYMAHGGTTFGQWGGANAPPYSAMVTSYDYNAPIGEQGNTTDKFFAVRNLLKNYLLPGEKLGEIPAPISTIAIPKFELIEQAPIFENLPRGKKSEKIQSMEMFDQGWGRIIYRTELAPGKVKRKLLIKEVHDWATVFIDGKPIGKMDRRRGDNSLEIPSSASSLRLDILVEATGRVNFGEAIIDRKGITDVVELSDGNTVTELKNWTVYSFPVDYAFQKRAKFGPKSKDGPAWYRGNFELAQTGDTFLDMSTWGKGMVWVNGHNMGRFWKIGPQQTLFVPGVWLKKGRNEIIVLDVDKPLETVIAGLKEPILDKINPDQSLLSRSKDQNLNLSAEKPVLQGSFAEGNGWQEIRFDKVKKGRYFCLEALNAQTANDPLTTIAELELTGIDGKLLSSLKWKVIYADSEEITAANHAADRVYDKQESTFWQSQSVGDKPQHPHQLIIDLGEEVQLKGFKYLPRSDKSKAGMIKDYRIYLKTDNYNF
ncbi:beta-galactosidase [Solitalea koreensis]|uniref:Beta-galactosidase n=1 Tax=Solitalea koreensis TaxID=543615 RepID=A0A521BNQ5_9SPHI|nr:beta-galactosidase [Solitalea koreensis]SMO48773.1 beta-galactosidase [Solitalea koreensis]